MIQVPRPRALPRKRKTELLWLGGKDKKHNSPAGGFTGDVVVVVVVAVSNSHLTLKG